MQVRTRERLGCGAIRFRQCASQNDLPHIRQWCRRKKKENDLSHIV
eukprot:SAG22_NODE_16209_length_330_cov_4.246753_1_plen_45_part_10